jgi:hypothetical protein
MASVGRKPANLTILTDRRARGDGPALISRQMRRRCVEWVMFYRISVAACAAAVAGLLLVPAQSNARGGAGMVGHGGGFHPPVRPTHPVHRPLVRRHDPLFVHRNFRERHAFEHRRHRRNADGFGGYGYGGGGYGGNGYGGNGYGSNGYGDNGYGDNGYGDNAYGNTGYGDYGYCNYGYGYRLTCGNFSAFYGRYYDPSDMPGSISVPPYTIRPAPVVLTAGRLDPPINRGGCRSETVPMPSPGAAERSVTITRC